MKAIIAFLFLFALSVSAQEDPEFNQTHFKADHAVTGLCGNGVLDAGEQCDTGINNVPKPPSPLSGKQGCCWNDCTLRPWTVSPLPVLNLPNCERNVFAITKLFSSSTIRVQNMISVEKTVDTCGDLQVKPGAVSPYGTAYYLPPLTSGTKDCQVSIKATINCGGPLVSLEKGTTLHRTC